MWGYGFDYVRMEMQRLGFKLRHIGIVTYCKNKCKSDFRKSTGPTCLSACGKLKNLILYL